MGEIDQLSDLDLAALVASKICHDAIGPMTAIGFGLDVLDEDDDEEQQDNAVGMIRRSIAQITAKIQFARLAFGAAGTSGFEIDLMEAQKVARDYAEADNKHKVEWSSSIAAMPKNNVKLLLNLVSIAMSAIPRGGAISVNIAGDSDRPDITLRSVGEKARVPAGVIDLINGTPEESVDARSIQPYFAGRVAKAVGANISIDMDGQDVLLVARFS
jgi:histidine phosphotransferase ChpT